MYCLQLIESALEDIMDDGWGKPFNQFSSEEKQEAINAVIKAFDDDGLFILRDKYVTTGKSGVLSAEDFFSAKQRIGASMNFNNLHALAATIIPQQSMSWIRFKENIENAMGVTVPVYYPSETITGSLQPMDAQDVAKLGLSIRSEHATLITSADVKPAKEGEQPDRIVYAGRTFEPVAITNWSAQDGWRKLVLVAV